MTGIKINKYIRQWLTGCEELTEIVQSKNIQPLVIAPTTQPFITYQHGPIHPNYTKAGLAYDDLEVAIACVSNEYEQAIEIADIIRKLLECKMYHDEDTDIREMQFVEITEDMFNDMYVQTLVLKIQIATKIN